MKMRFRKFVCAAVAIVLVVGLAGCTTNADGSQASIVSDISLVSGNRNLSPEQKALRNRDRDYASARLQGAVLGALAGGLTCAMRDCSEEQTAAAVAAGGAIGYIGTGYLVRNNQNFVASQETLDADLASVKDETKSLRGDVRLSQAVFDQQRTRTNDLLAAYRSGNATEKQMQDQLKTLQQDINEVTRLRTDAEQRIAGLEQAKLTYDRRGYNTNELDARLSEKRTYVEQLKRIERAMIGTHENASQDVAI